MPVARYENCLQFGHSHRHSRRRREGGGVGVRDLGEEAVAHHKADALKQRGTVFGRIRRQQLSRPAETRRTKNNMLAAIHRKMLGSDNSLPYPELRHVGCRRAGDHGARGWGCGRHRDRGKTRTGLPSGSGRVQSTGTGESPGRGPGRGCHTGRRRRRWKRRPSWRRPPRPRCPSHHCWRRRPRPRSPCRCRRPCARPWPPWPSHPRWAGFVWQRASAPFLHPGRN